MYWLTEPAINRDRPVCERVPTTTRLASRDASTSSPRGSSTTNSRVQDGPGSTDCQIADTAWR